MPNGHILTPAFIDKLKHEFRLDWNGVHGVSHWARVRSNGLRLAIRNGASSRIIEYFAFLHDVCRRNEGKDPDHGSRAALYARKIRGDFIDLNDRDFSLLTDALGGHTHAKYHDNVTVMTCWDADRLDLMRVGITPEPGFLCTPEGRNPELIAEACENARAWIRAREAKT